MVCLDGGRQLPTVGRVDGSDRLRYGMWISPRWMSGSKAADFKP